MPKITRRAALIQYAGIAAPLLGCGGGSTSEATSVTNLPAGGTPSTTAPAVTARPASAAAAPDTPPTSVTAKVVLPPLMAGIARYRSQHTYLLQGTSWDVQTARIAGGSDMKATVGPSSTHVDAFCGWPWDRTGGDWLDRDGVRHGSAAWASFKTPASPIDLVQRYETDVTGLLRKVTSDNRWCAFLLSPLKGYRKIATLWNRTQPSPTLIVRYADGSQANLRCVATSAVKPGVPDPIAPSMVTPMFIEFERPTREVASATMSLTVTEHSSSTAADIEIYLLDPPLNRDSLSLGVAASVGPLDAGIESAPGIIGAHRYVDGSALTDFVHPGPQINTWASREFDPALWGGEPDATKLPHLGLGKFITSNGVDWASLVDSSHGSDGFKPLVPGMGALKITMAAEAKSDGAVVAYGGTGACNASIFLPEPLFGRLPRIFVRHYMRLGTPEGNRYIRDPKNRFHVYHNEKNVAPAWTDWAGKFGITPDHTTSHGGTSGSAGGGYGWQMRLAWADCDANYGGPSEGGIRPGFHLFDFGSRNPSGFNYSGDASSLAFWGQRGGLGGMLYANQWYCIETELALNTVTDTAPGFLPDGELRAWIDGVLVFERKGMVFRTKPLYQPPLKPDNMAAVRDLGVRALWLNWYHGGVTQNTVQRSMFITGLAYGTQYIGPMRL